MEPHPDKPFAQAFSEATGEDMDIEFVEQQMAFALDHARIRRGEPSQLGYVLVERKNHPHAVVVFGTPAYAEEALSGHPLVDDLRQEDCTSAYVPPNMTLALLASKELILPR